MVDIRSATAENRRGKRRKKIERKKKLRFIELTDVSIDAIGKTKTNKMVFSAENLVLIKVRQEKVTTIDE